MFHRKKEMEMIKENIFDGKQQKNAKKVCVNIK